MKVIVTGAGGFVGKEIVGELLKNNNDVLGIGKTKHSKPPELENKVSSDYFASDITDYKNLTGLEKLENVDAVVHSAGLAHQFGDIEKEKFYKVNVLGTKNIAELAVKIKAGQFILISSTAIYGIKKNSIDEETVCQPETLYAESKLEAENICIEICRQNNLPLTILRLAPVIGENNVGNAARLVSAIDKKRFVWIGKGENLKTLIYKNDAARAVLKILQNKKAGIEVFNLAAKPVLMKEFVGEIEKQLKKKAPKFYIPSGILQRIFSINKKILGIAKINKISETVEKWLSDDIYSAQKIKKEYNFEAQTSIAEAIEKQVKFYLDENKKD
jgi:nucleoside-diphosphate-sugar epimerase